jgi:hypothetical protein
MHEKKLKEKINLKKFKIFLWIFNFFRNISEKIGCFNIAFVFYNVNI